MAQAVSLASLQRPVFDPKDMRFSADKVALAQGFL